MTQTGFAGRTALVTGSASGIGAACARWLDRQGIAELILVDLDGEGLRQLPLSCTTHLFSGDITDPALWQAITKQTGRLDHAVLNAGIADGGALVDQTFASWRRILSVNLDGAFLGLQAALRLMCKGQGGSIVLTGSSTGVKPLAGTAAYGCSKAAVSHLARVAALEHAKDAIRVNAVAPGRVETPLMTGTMAFRQSIADLGSREAALAAAAAQNSGIGAFSSADEIAGHIGFLLSDAAASITGTVLLNDAGFNL